MLLGKNPTVFRLTVISYFVLQLLIYTSTPQVLLVLYTHTHIYISLSFRQKSSLFFTYILQSCSSDSHFSTKPSSSLPIYQ